MKKKPMAQNNRFNKVYENPILIAFSFHSPLNKGWVLLGVMGLGYVDDKSAIWPLMSIRYYIYIFNAHRHPLGVSESLRPSIVTEPSFLLEKSKILL